jgi:PAS domain-containing protein
LYRQRKSVDPQLALAMSLGKYRTVLQADMSSILGCLQMGMVVIDTNFNILIWNHAVEDMWGLREEEVIEKSWFSLDINFKNVE